MSSPLSLIQDLVFPDYVLKNESDSLDSSFSVKVTINMDPQLKNQNFTNEIMFAAATRLQQIIAVLISSSIELHKIMSSSNQSKQEFCFCIETSPSLALSSPSSIRINFIDWMSRVFVPTPKNIDQQQIFSPIQKFSVFVKQIDFLMVKTPFLTEYLFGKILASTPHQTTNLFQKSLQNAKNIFAKAENNNSIKTMLALLIFLIPSTTTSSNNINSKSLLTSNNFSHKLFSCSPSELYRLFFLYFLQEKSFLIDNEAEIIAKCEPLDDGDEKMKLKGSRRQRNDKNDATDGEVTIYGNSRAAVSYRKRLSLVGIFSLLMMSRNSNNSNSSFDEDYSSFFKMSFLSMIFALSKMTVNDNENSLKFENEFVKYYFSSSRNKEQNENQKENFIATQSLSCWWRVVQTVEISHSLDLHNVSMVKTLNANKSKTRRLRSSDDNDDDDYEESEDVSDDESESNSDDGDEENENAVGFTCKVRSKFFANPKISNNKSLFVFPILLLHISLFVPTPEQVHRYQFGSKNNNISNPTQFSMSLGLSSHSNNNNINKKGILKKNNTNNVETNNKNIDNKYSSVFLVPSTLHNNASVNQNFSKMIRVSVYFFREGGICEKTWRDNNNSIETVQEDHEENVTTFSSNHSKPSVKFDFFEQEIIEILSSSSSSSSLGNNQSALNQGMLKNTSDDNIALSLSTSFMHIVADPFLNHPMVKFMSKNSKNHQHRDNVLGKIGKVLATCESRESKQSDERHRLIQNVIGQRLIQEYERNSFVVVGKNDTSNTRGNNTPNANFLHSFYSFNKIMSSFLPSGEKLMKDEVENDDDVVTTCASLSKSILTTIPPRSASTRDDTKAKFLRWGKERVLFLLRRCVAHLSQRQQQKEQANDENVEEAIDRMKERIHELLEEN